MTLRMVFDREDLCGVRVAAAPDPMWETVLSLHRLRDRQVAARYQQWQLRARGRLPRDSASRQCLATLFTLVPRRGGFPDFLTPDVPVPEVGACCEQVAYTRRGRLRSDLHSVFAGRAVPRWVRELAEGDRDRLRHVVAAIRRAYDWLVAPQWHDVCETVAADRTTRVGMLARAGVGALLAGIPGVRDWDGEALHIAYPCERTVHLAGRGLMLVPSKFCAGTPVTLIDPDLPPVLIYPAAGGVWPAAGASAQLVAMFGRTRAESLAALTTPRTTTTLAVHLGTSVSAASRHTAVLRQAGLITSARHGSATVHQLTRLGAAVLAGVLRDD